MNEAMISRLPRFDTRQLHLADPVPRKETETQSRQDGLSACLHDDAAPHTAFEGGAEIDLSNETDTDLERQAALDQAILTIATAIEDLHQTVRKDATAAMSQIASALFPKLSELFLAEEIARHLPALIPDTIKGVEISAAPEMAADLKQAAERVDGLTSHLNFIPAGHFERGRIEVSWRTGGFDFDFDSLLASCMSSMNLEYAKDRE